jgi:two-component system chemotaxis sensor kinase CheA
MPTDPSSDDGGSVFSEFLADYFIECDEHLVNARQSILALEPMLQQATVDRGLLDELFRSFHSLKGLSAMVGFHEAEQLAHHLEAFLAAVRKDQVRLEVAGLETLVSGISMLEQVIAARRDSAVSPDTAPLILQVAGLLPRQTENSPATGSAPPPAPASSRPAEKDRIIAAKLRPGTRAWQITFEPSPELVTQGIDVNSVRRKLQSLGELVHSEPLIDASGRIVFAFVLVSDNEQVPEQLRSEGLVCTPFIPTSDTSEAAVAPGPSATTDAENSKHLTPANLVRVDLSRLDELMRMVGELVLSRARLDDNLRRLTAVIPGGEMRALQETNSAIERQLRDLREGVMRVRMVSVREVFARMRFVVRDLVRELGKQATLRFSGEDTQIDKYVVERIMDPLLHLVRNAVSHGLEPSEARVAAGKSAVGHIDLRARTTGEIVVIEVEDDGRGIDTEAIAAQARARGIATPPLASTDPVLDILCTPGFSTREQPDRASGRGVGMDVVRTAVEEMGGSFSMETKLGRGTRFVIQLPLTLAITDALIVKIADQRFAVPQVAVREVLHSESDNFTRMENNELLRYHGGVIPLFRLARLFGLESARQAHCYTLVIGEGVQAVGLAVDRVLGLREVVVRPLTDRLVKVPGIAGATELGDGRVVLILDVSKLIRVVRQSPMALKPAVISSPGATSFVMGKNVGVQ